MSFEKDAVVLEKNRRLERIFFAIAALLAIGGVLQLIFAGGMPYLFYLLSLPLGFAARAATDNWRARPRNASVRAGADGVWVDGKCVVEPAKIVQATVQPRVGSKPTVRLRNKQRAVVFETEVENEAEGVAFLRAIGHDASSKKATFPMMSPLVSTRARTAITMTVLLGLLFAVPLTFGVLRILGAPLIATIIVTMAAGFFALRKTDVEVGADGLSISWNRRRRFVRWDDVRAIETPAADAVNIVLTSGETIPLRMIASGSGFGASERRTMHRDAFQRRMVEAIEAHRSRIGPRELAAMLMPKERTEQWLTDLRKLREGEGGYRAAAVREEDLWRVVEDPGAPEEARAAAAMLLRKTEGAKPRLRIAADAVASPKLRVALEAEEEEQTEEALKAYLR